MVYTKHFWKRFALCLVKQPFQWHMMMQIDNKIKSINWANHMTSWSVHPWSIQVKYAKRWQGFAKHLFGQLRSFSENAHNSWTAQYILIKLCIRMHKVKVRKKAKIRNKYNQISHLTKDTIWESDNNTRKHHIHVQESHSQQVSTRLHHVKICLTTGMHNSTFWWLWICWASVQPVMVS